MNERNKNKHRFPGFYECENHDMLREILPLKPQTLCRPCFKRVHNNLTLHVAKSMAALGRLEHFTAAHNKTLQHLLLRMDKLNDQVTDLQNQKQDKCEE